VPAIELSGQFIPCWSEGGRGSFCMYLWYRYASLANPNAWIVLLVRTKCSSVSGMCLDMILQLPCVFKRLTIPSAVTIAPHPSPRGIIHPSIHSPPPCPFPFVFNGR
jgi:hypothetical protein